MVRPDLKRFFVGKRLSAFLVSEKTIDGKLAADLGAFANRANQLQNVLTCRKVDVQQLIHTAAKLLRRRLRAYQR